MKIAIALLAALAGGFVTVATTQEANAAVYCRYIGFPKGCIVRPGVVLVARPAPVRVVKPVVVAPRRAVRPVARAGVPGNRGGPVNRVGRF
jgi:hypothetical protein